MILIFSFYATNFRFHFHPLHYLHFAPASVIHVIETKAFSEVLRLLTAYERSKILSNYPTRTVLQNAFSALYVLVDNKESSSSSDESVLLTTCRTPHVTAY